MSYGKIFKVDNVAYLLEINEMYVYIAKVINEKDDRYSSIFEGDYDSFFWSDELKELNKLEYEERLYAVLIGCLNWKGITNSLALYQKYINSLLEDGHTKEDILSSGSDELLVYRMYFPLDREAIKFKTVSTSLIERFKSML